MSTEMRKAIAYHLKRLRLKAGLTLEQVGNLVGKSKKTISAWENNHGQPDAEMLMALCDIYNVDNILAEFKESPDEALNLTQTEKELVLAYRKRPDLQNAVKILLGLKKSEPVVHTIERAARSGTPETDSALTDDELEAIANGLRLKPTDDL